MINFQGETDETGYVDGIYLMFPQHVCGGGQCGCVTHIMIIIYTVHGGTSLMELTHITSALNDLLDDGSLANVNLGHDADIPVNVKEHCLIFGQNLFSLSTSWASYFSMDR